MSIKEKYGDTIEKMWALRNENRKFLRARCDTCTFEGSMSFCDCAKASFIQRLSIEEIEKFIRNN